VMHSGGGGGVLLGGPTLQIDLVAAHRGSECLWPLTDLETHTMCLKPDKFKETVVAADGFEWVDEGKPGNPKWGYVSTRPHDSLTFQARSKPATLKF
jgi:hypothetical protein